MESIRLYDTNVYEGCEKVTLEIYVKQRSKELSVRKRPAVIIFPGGGYAFTSDREAEPVADLFLYGGFQVFVLRYTVAPIGSEINPLLDAAKAIVWVREHSEEYFIDKKAIAVCGFSAGGHLAGYISTCFNDKRVLEKLGIKENDARPDATILGYSVVSAFKKINSQTILNILNTQAPTDEERSRVSVDKLVTDTTPPAFIWATSDDDCVPVYNSLCYADALSDHNIPFELHIFPKGGHGISISTKETQPDWDEACRYDNPYIARWGEWAIKWLNSTFTDMSYNKLI